MNEDHEDVALRLKKIKAMRHELEDLRMITVVPDNVMWELTDRGRMALAMLISPLDAEQIAGIAVLSALV